MSELLGTLGGAAIGIAVGEAGSTILEPALEAPRQEAWKESKARILELPELATLVAQALNSLSDVLEDAQRNGYDEDQLRSAVQLALKSPGIAESLTLYRRAAFDGAPLAGRETLLEHAFAKAQIEAQYWPALKMLSSLPLESAQLAQGIHRGYIKYSAPGFIAPPTTPGKVPFYPQTDIDAQATATANGEDAEQLQVLVGIAGLPLSLFEMLELLNRGLVTTDDVQRAIANSNLQNQYMDVALELRRMLLTPHEYAELFIRGWISQQEMYDGGALRGMEQADMDLLAEGIGRPLAVHQVTTGMARGGTFGGDYAGVPEPYLSALRQSNIRPEWGNLAYANRYTYPSYFVIKPLVSSGAITVDEAAQIFENEGWPPDLASKAAASFAESGTGGKKLSDAAIKAGYKVGSITPADALTRIEANGYSAADAQIIFAGWNLPSDTAVDEPH